MRKAGRIRGDTGWMDAMRIEEFVYFHSGWKWDQRHLWSKGFETVEMVTHWANTWVKCGVGGGVRVLRNSVGLLEFRFGKVLTRTASKYCKVQRSNVWSDWKSFFIPEDTAWFQPRQYQSWVQGPVRDVSLTNMFQDWPFAQNILLMFETKIILSLWCSASHYGVRWPKIFVKIKEMRMSGGILVHFPV